MLSIGGVGTNVTELPDRYKSVKSINVIIDYDGDDELYEKRLSKFKELGAPIKMELEKGEDINSMYIDGRSDEVLKFLGYE